MPARLRASLACVLCARWARLPRRRGCLPCWAWVRAAGTALSIHSLRHRQPRAPGHSTPTYRPVRPARPLRPCRRWSWSDLPLPPVLPQRSRADQAGRGAPSYWLAAVSASSEQLGRPRRCSSVPRLVLSAVRVPRCQRPLRYTDTATSAAWPLRPRRLHHGGSALTTSPRPPGTSAPWWRAGPWNGACMRPRREALAYTQAAFRGCSPRPSRASRPCSRIPNLRATAASALLAHRVCGCGSWRPLQQRPLLRPSPTSQPLALQVPALQRITVVGLVWEITLQDTKWAALPQSCCSIHGTAVHGASLPFASLVHRTTCWMNAQARAAQSGHSRHLHTLPCSYKPPRPSHWQVST